MKRLVSLVLSLALVLSLCAFAQADDLPTITIMFHGSNVSDDSVVLEKVNEYIADKVGAKLEVIWGTWGDFDDKATNALLSGDSDVDMIFTCSWSADEFNKYAKDGYFYELDELVDAYGAELKAAIPEALMTAATVVGPDGEKHIYAVNGFKDTATQIAWDVNVTLLNELGYTLDDVKNLGFFGWGEIFAKAKEVKGDAFYPFLVEPMVAERAVTNTIIVTGDSGNVNLLSYYMNPDDLTQPTEQYGNVMLNKFATEEYKACAETMRAYYVAGYIDPALAVAETSNDTRTNAQKEANYLIGTQSYAYGYEYSAEVTSRGIEVANLPCTDPSVDTTVSQGAMIAISSASEHPEESFKFLNLLNSDPTLMTLLNYGVEGVQYNLTEDGLVDFYGEDNELLPGRSAYQPWTNGMGNVTILPDTKSEGAGFRKAFQEFYASGKAIPVLGFIFDSSEVETEMGALANVAAQYALALDCGAVDPETELPKFLSALDAAGMQKYLDAANEQVKAFLGE